MKCKGSDIKSDLTSLRTSMGGHAPPDRVGEKGPCTSSYTTLKTRQIFGGGRRKHLIRLLGSLKELSSLRDSARREVAIGANTEVVPVIQSCIWICWKGFVFPIPINCTREAKE
jgi:hypothetical protein